MKPEIDIDLGNGFRLVAERNSDPDYDREIMIGIMNDRDGWIQDLAIVRNYYTYDDATRTVWKSGLFEVLVYGNPDVEDCSNCYRIPISRYVLNNG